MGTPTREANGGGGGGISAATGNKPKRSTESTELMNIVSEYSLSGAPSEGSEVILQRKSLQKIKQEHWREPDDRQKTCCGPLSGRPHDRPAEDRCMLSPQQNRQTAGKCGNAATAPRGDCARRTTGLPFQR